MRTILTIAVCLLFSGIAFAQEPAHPASSGKMVSIEVVIAEYSLAGNVDPKADLSKADDIAAKLSELEQQGAFISLNTITLTTIDRTKAMVQIGQRISIPTGRTFAPRPRGGGGEGPGAQGVMSIQMSEQQVGTLIAITPELNDDGKILLQFQVEKSDLSPQPREVEGAVSDVPTPRTSSLTCQSSIVVQPGKTVVAGSSKKSAQGEASQMLVLVSANLEE